MIIELLIAGALMLGSIVLAHANQGAARRQPVYVPVRSTRRTSRTFGH